MASDKLSIVSLRIYMLIRLITFVATQRKPLSPPILISSTAKDSLINTTAVLECIFRGYTGESKTPSVTWFDDTGKKIIAGHDYQLDNNGRMLKITKVKEEDEKVYTCRGTDSLGSSDGQLFLNVTSKPIWVKSLEDLVIQEDDNAIFTCIARSAKGENPPNAPEWFRDGKQISSLNADPGKYVFSQDMRELTVSHVKQNSDIGCFQCSVSNSIGKELSKGCLKVLSHLFPEQAPSRRTVVAISRTESLPTLINSTAKDSLTVLINTTADLECIFRGYTAESETPSVTWFDDTGKKIIAGDDYQLDNNGTMLKITKVKEEDEKVYTCRGTNSLGTSDGQLFLNVTSKPIWVKSLEDLVIEQDDNATFTCIARSAKGENPPNAPEWFRDGKQISSLNADPGKYVFSQDMRELTVSHVKQNSDIGCFQCSVSNSIGKELSKGCLKVLSHLFPEQAPSRRTVVAISRTESLPTLINSTDKDSLTVLINTTADLECIFRGYTAESETPSVTWFDDTGKKIIAGDDYQLDNNGTMLKITKVKEEDEKVYTCRGTNSLGTSEGQLFLNVTSNPIWVKSLEDLVIEQDDNATFTCIARSAKGENPPNAPEWFRDGKQISSLNADPGKYVFSQDMRELTVSHVKQNSDIGCFQCSVSNSIGKELSKGCLKVLKRQMPPKLNSISSEKSLTVLRNKVAVLECTFSGDAVVITWLDDSEADIILDGRHQIKNGGQVLSIDMVQEEDEQIYRCRGTNHLGTADGRMFLNVTSTPIWEKPLKNQTTPEGEDAMFTCMARSAKGENPPDPPEWYINGTNNLTLERDSEKYVFSSDKRELTVKNTEIKTDSNTCFKCSVSNSVGTEFSSGCLCVINKTRPNDADRLNEERKKDVLPRIWLIETIVILLGVSALLAVLCCIRCCTCNHTRKDRKESENVFADASYFNRIADRGNRDFGETSNQKSTSLLIGKQTNA